MSIDASKGVMPFWNTDWFLMILYLIHHGDPLPNEHLTLTNQEYFALSTKLIASLSNSLAGGLPDAGEAGLLKSSPILRKLGIQVSDSGTQGAVSVTISGIGTVSHQPLRVAG